MDKVENPFLKPNKLVAILFYAFMTFIGSGLLIMLIALIYSNTTDEVTYQELMNRLVSNDLKGASSALKIAYGKVNAIGNMSGYLLMLVVVGFYMRNHLIKDTLEWKQRYKFFVWFIPVAAVLFYGISLGIDYLVSGYVGSSTNQISIELMIQEGGAFYMFIAVVICAPLVEELIYRKAVFCFLEKQHIAISYVVSVVLFALPHMLTTTGVGAGEWLLLSIPYVTSAIMLAVIYHLSGKNIYATWITHLLNNLISFIIIAATF